MVDRVKIIQIDLTVYPFQVKAFNEDNKLMRTWNFNTKDEAIKATNEINLEVLRAKNAI